ncbi:MAG: response regulator [Gemmatimonadota bacterium]
MPRVLVVDDDLAVVKALTGFLVRAGYEVVSAGSAAEALEALGRPPEVDAVVSDILMPGMSGLALYDTIVARVPGLARRVVFLTGAARDPAIHDPVESRGVPLISKLNDFRLVVDAVRLALLSRTEAR